MVEALVFYGSFVSFTLWKIKMEPENDGSEDVFLFNWVIFWFRLLIFQVVSHFELLFSKSTPLRGKEKMLQNI